MPPDRLDELAGEWLNAGLWEQIAPGGPPANWLILGGRGAGKTRLGAEWVNGHVRAFPPFARVHYARIALVGETLGDVREVMIDGPSGIVATARGNRARYEAGRRRVVWDNGAVGFAFSAEDPDSLRGAQFDAAWCDELGCPAVDKGPGQPNVFPDAKSAEDGLPHFSSGARADAAPFALGLAQLDHWDGQAADFDTAANPLSDVYGGPMVDPSYIHFWAWDARPFPAFPNRSDIWGDGDNWLAGHWLNGRLDGSPVADIVNAVLADHGRQAADTSRVSGTLTGYVLAEASTARGALEPLADLFGLAVGDDGGRLVFAQEAAARDEPLPLQDFVVPDGDGAVVTQIRVAEPDLPAETVLSFRDPLREYQSATARSFTGGQGGIRHMAFPGVLDPALGAALLEDWSKRKAAAREQVRFRLDQSRIDVVPGGLVRIGGEAADALFLVTDVESGVDRAVAARRLATARPAGWGRQPGEPRPVRATRAGPPLLHLLDLPMMAGAAGPHEQLRAALRARPWIAHALHASPADSGFVQRALVRHEATVGVLADALAPGFEGRFDRAGWITLDLWSGALSSVPDIQLLAGANRAAVRSLHGDWEVLQFGLAEEVEPGRWRLSRLLRGQCGTRIAMLAGAAAGADVVLLDAAVVPAGVQPGEIGLPLNWRAGPVGYDFGGPTFASAVAAGGGRARRPLPPAHLAVRRLPGGDRAISWIRRGRVDADRGLSGDVPLGEEVERYEVTVSRDGTPLRSVLVDAPAWTYAAAAAGADFPVPGAGTVTVRQISVSAGAGDAAVASFAAG